MSRQRTNEPFFWALFSSGGMLAALVWPAVALFALFALPLGWGAPAEPERLAALLAPPLVRLALFVLVALSAFHWAHRFRFTLYDGLQLHHLFGLIATICYGGATALTIAAGWLLWTAPG